MTNRLAETQPKLFTGEDLSYTVRHSSEDLQVLWS